MKILFLHSEVMGYNISTIKKMIQNNIEVSLVHWDHKKLSNYKIEALPNLKIYKRSEMSKEDITTLVKELKPDITVVSGWFDKGYLFATKYLRRKNKVVVCLLDSQWEFSIKNTIKKLIFNLNIPSLFFSHYWIPGIPQYNFLKKLNIKDSKIIFDALSADTVFFQKIFDDTHKNKKNNYPHKFFFAGRFDKIKGIKTLIEAWENISKQRLDWKLKVIGNGDQKKLLEDTKDVEVIDFVQPNKFSEELIDVGCFILPSLKEPWGVVVHEFSAAGLPLLLSDKVGAKDDYLIQGYNGYQFKAGNSESLFNSMLKIINSNDKSLYQMGKNSNSISKKVTIDSSVANLLSSLVSNNI
jgi:glycosyltransferase involved in cell wall biosynthesis